MTLAMRAGTLLVIATAWVLCGCARGLLPEESADGSPGGDVGPGPGGETQGGETSDVVTTDVVADSPAEPVGVDAAPVPCSDSCACTSSCTCMSGGGGCGLKCAAGSMCTLHCTAGCSITCPASSMCLMICDAMSSCSIGCMGTRMDCADGSVACNMPCP